MPGVPGSAVNRIMGMAPGERWLPRGVFHYMGCGLPRARRALAMTHYKKCIGRADVGIGPYGSVARGAGKRADVGSELSAAGGRGSEVSEWLRSKFPSSAVRQRRNFGHRNRIIGPYGGFTDRIS